MKHIIFVCLGNICRSPMAEAIMKELAPQWNIESRATSSWEHGNPIHLGTRKILEHYHISYDKKKESQQISKADADACDIILAMDQQNINDLKKMLPYSLHHKIHLLAKQDVPDPWYTGNFQETYLLISQACQDWLKTLS
ncbi:low molecular weight phosphotyrosine protein phosphatase [Streptococcus sp. X16XC17]|uniref:low molecular weight protein-tyrosine-phosphatase n=1 Tax=unclassified Streptococcus TaxID=2608887 RepID=UPI00066FE457|nr:MULTISPECIES: low molecular weight protein-tyrosine-phosphatase [unclassified Streptococcus]TCD46058.1 low molecular weight phosphotyrosine protein phosphatase [Streptococcus sp. X16XC17]